MLSLIPMDQDQVVAMRLDGAVSSEDIEAVDAALADRLTRHDRVRIYVEIASLGPMELEAFLKDLKMGLAYWKKVERKAAVTDAAWMQKLARIADPIFPQVLVKAFSFDEVEEARRWIAEGL